MARFTKRDAGVWIDGAFGEQHLYENTAVILYECGAWEEAAKMREAASVLRAAPDVDSCEEARGMLDAYMAGALEVMRGYTDAGLEWHLEAGDLVLVDTSEEAARETAGVCDAQ